MHFDVLREANAARVGLFKNAKGETQHSGVGAGDEWTPNDWFTAMAGELGEAGNVLKKIRRGDFTMDEARHKVAQELADVVIYLDMLAHACGINLGQAVMDTFNAKSREKSLPILIRERGLHHGRHQSYCVIDTNKP
jgi:NTP pyrophosphatase (non-canonical NTP hydrolase)